MNLHFAHNLFLFLIYRFIKTPILYNFYTISISSKRKTNTVEDRSFTDAGNIYEIVMDYSSAFTKRIRLLKTKKY